MRSRGAWAWRCGGPRSSTARPPSRLHRRVHDLGLPRPRHTHRSSSPCTSRCSKVCATSCTTTPSAGHRQSRPRGDAAPSARRGGDGVPGLLAELLGRTWRSRVLATALASRSTSPSSVGASPACPQPANWPPPAARSCCSSRRSSWRTTTESFGRGLPRELRPAHRASAHGGQPGRLRHGAGAFRDAPVARTSPHSGWRRRVRWACSTLWWPRYRPSNPCPQSARSSAALRCRWSTSSAPPSSTTPRRSTCSDCTRASVRGLVEAGGSVVRSACVRTLEPAGGGWRLGWAGGGLSAAAVVLAAGAWCDELAALAGARPLRLRPLRRTIAVCRVPAGSSLDPEGPLVSDAAHSWYFKPEVRTCSYRRPTRRPVSRATPGPTRPTSPSASKRERGHDVGPARWSARGPV